VIDPPEPDCWLHPDVEVGPSPNGYGNHSCDPNLWWVGPYELAARRNLSAGEELINDYATSTAATPISGSTH
jgi:hypothetical protein